VHLEPGAIEALRAVYADHFPSGGTVLDLMSSWRSHLPEGLGRVVGLGMNADEMAANPQLDDWVIHDLNREPRLPFPDASFDAVACAVSVQYLVRPLDVFADVLRVLVPGGPLVVSFSNRCFPTKAVAIWLSAGDEDHRRLVRTYLERAGFLDVADERVATPDDPLFVVTGRGVAPAPGGGT
jgi:SAM-dependent methyltransferase